MTKELSVDDTVYAFADIPRLIFPNSEEPLIGVDILQEFLIKNNDSIEKQMIEV